MISLKWLIGIFCLLVLIFFFCLFFFLFVKKKKKRGGGLREGCGNGREERGRMENRERPPPCYPGL